jgi:hypothetical protein
MSMIFKEDYSLMKIRAAMRIVGVLLFSWRIASSSPQLGTQVKRRQKKDPRPCGGGPNPIQGELEETCSL